MKKDNSRKYARYLLEMPMAKKVPKERDEWDAMFNVRQQHSRARALRQFKKNPEIRAEYLTQQLLGKDDNGVSNAIAYLHERIKTLSSKIAVDEKKLHVIRDEIRDGSRYTLLLRAKLEEYEGSLILLVKRSSQ
jgi:hypothetical protein